MVRFFGFFLDTDLSQDALVEAALAQSRKVKLTVRITAHLKNLSSGFWGSTDSAGWGK
jgi:hypothetical protein